MSSDTSMLRAKLRQALTKIGKSNGLMCPPTKSNIDPQLHELFITSEAASYFKDRHEKARDTVIALAVDKGELEAAVARATKNVLGESITGAEGELYSVIIDLAKPAKRLDQTALRNALITKHKMTRDEVEKLFDACSDYASPAKRVKVVGR